MSIIHDEYEQGSQDWMQARAGVPTASEFDALVTPKFEIRKGKTPETYLARKLAEYWIAGPLMGFNSFAAEAGQIRETEAFRAYEFHFDETIRKVGFVTNDAGTIGCSPDGLIGEDGGIEIKCPEAHTHVNYLMAGEVPDDYLAQVHGNLYVTGRKWWRFMSYRAHFPALYVQVNRDEAIMEVLDEALRSFLAKFDRCKKLLEQLNKGPSSRRETVMRTLEQAKDVKFSWEQNAGEEPAELIP